MEYPETKLTKPLRRFIFLFFIGLFLLISPAIILYTSGYRYDFKNGFLRETGSINIDITPNWAEVYLNNTKLKSRFPIRLNNLVPGKFSLNITSPGYFDWHKNIEVKNKETIYIKDIILLKKTEPVFLHEGKVIELVISNDGKFLIYSLIKEKEKELWQKNIKTGENLLVTKLSDLEPLDIIFSPDNSYYIISTKQKPYSKIFIFNTQKPEKNIDLTAYTKMPITKYNWRNGSLPEIYYSTKEQIMIFNPENMNQTFVNKNNFIDWFFENNQLWVIQINSSTNNPELIKDYLGFHQIFNNDFGTETENWEILTAKNDFILLKKKNQAEMLLFTQNKKYTLAGENYIISKYNNWLIAWSTWEIWTRAQNEEPVLLNRSGMQLKQIIPLDKHNTLGLVWADNTTVLFPYYLVSHELLAQQITTAISDSDNRTLFFGGKYNDKNGLWKLEY